MMTLFSHCAVILGGYINGYSIIKELYTNDVDNIILVDNSRNIASYSNKIKKFYKVDKNAKSLRQTLEVIHKEFDKIVLFPTDDHHIELLYELYEEIKEYCFIPFNPENILDSLDKFVQYSYCEKLNVPYPKTIELSNPTKVNDLSEFPFPILIKPNKRKDLTINVFRSLTINNHIELNNHRDRIVDYLNNGITFLASEIIPGEGSDIYAYVGYRDQKGNIRCEWTGKKLSQFPNDYGVFSSASNEAPNEVLEQGRKLLAGMNLYGICEPEFKFDHRDGKYKLMEINLRSMMWHRVGHLSGVMVQYSQYLDGIGLPLPDQIQNRDEVIHFIYSKHEIINLLTRRKYFRKYVYNYFHTKKRFFAVYEKNDIKPFLIDSFRTVKGLLGHWLKLLKII
jgi:D-aspartate ligase